MNDSVGRTIWKSILAVIVGFILGSLIRWGLAHVIVWFMGMGILKFLIIGNIVGCAIYWVFILSMAVLSVIFKNRVASGISAGIISIFLIILIVNMWCVPFEFSDSEWFKAFYITIAVGLMAWVSIASAIFGDD